MDIEELKKKYRFIVKDFEKEPLMIDSYVLGVIGAILTVKGTSSAKLVKEIKEVFTLAAYLKTEKLTKVKE